MLGTFLTIDATDTDQMIDYTSDLMSDLSPILIIVVSVGVGIIIFWAIMKSIKQ